MTTDPYATLAERLDSLPNGFPATPDGIELRLLAKLFTPEEAELASQLHRTFETSAQVAARIGGDPSTVRKLLKGMARKGLISAGPIQGGIGFGLMPFVVGIYEMQNERLDAELAELFEEYYHQALGARLAETPSVHRVIPVQESIPTGLEVQPFESVSTIVENSQAWGVVDCICRKQKMLVGDPCEHPLDVCMTLSDRPGAFDTASSVRALTREEAHATLKRAADAGLVHTLSNHQDGLWYICNCCTCSCGILRGMADLGIANVVARSAYVNTVDHERCQLCGSCVERCQFNALELDLQLEIDVQRCVGCGSCVLVCPEDALALALRSPAEISAVPVSNEEWMAVRARSRGIELIE